MNVIPLDVYDKDGNLLRIEFYDHASNFIFQSIWDENDPQDSEHREFFRKWSYKMAGQLGYEVNK